MSLALGIIGVFLPLLPTTPFLLLAGYCFARSSERFHRWIYENRIFGKVLRDYRDGKGIPARIKLASMIVLWFAIIYTIIQVLTSTLWRIALVLVGIGVTIHLALLRGRRKDSRSDQQERGSKKERPT